jgi:hypothetical protein
VNRGCRIEIPSSGIVTGVGVVPRDEGRGEPVECSTGARCESGVNLDQALARNVRTCRPDAKGEAQVADTTRARVPMRGTGAETLVVGMKVLQWGWTEGASVLGGSPRVQPARG